MLLIDCDIIMLLFKLNVDVESTTQGQRELLLHSPHCLLIRFMGDGFLNGTIDLYFSIKDIPALALNPNITRGDL